MEFQYVAYTADWRIVKGNISIASERAAEQALAKQGFQPIAIKATSVMPGIDQIFPSLFAVKPKDIVMFSRQLATLLEAGVSLVPALQMLEEQHANRTFRQKLTSVLNDLRSGSHFSDALQKQSKTFGELYCKLVAVGEQTGGLENSLKQAAAYIEKEDVAKKKVQRALTYPTLVLVVAAVVVTVLILFVLPSMVSLFTSVGAELPWTTRLLVGLADFASRFKMHILVGMGALVLCGVVAVRQPAVRYQIHRLSLTIPVLGPVIRMSEMSRFSRTVALLFRAGLPLPAIMDMARQTTTNGFIKDALAKVQEELVQGQGLSAPMSKNKLFPRLLVQMVMVGEESGNLESTLNILADSYETEADSRVSGLIALIEPTMTIGLGLMVGFITISIFSPIYSILGKMG